MQKMSNYLDNSQMIRLEQTLEEVLRSEEIVQLKSSEELLDELNTTFFEKYLDTMSE